MSTKEQDFKHPGFGVVEKVKNEGMNKLCNNLMKDNSALRSENELLLRRVMDLLATSNLLSKKLENLQSKMGE